MTTFVKSSETPPIFFTPNSLFTAPELRALSLDGLITHVVDNVFVPINTPRTPKVRALAMIHLLPVPICNKVILGRQSAAWVWAGRKTPDIHCLLYMTCNRFTLRKRVRHFDIYPAALTAEDTHTFYPHHGIPDTASCIKVTSFERTIYDLLLQEPARNSVPLITSMFMENPNRLMQKVAICTKVRTRLFERGGFSPRRQKAAETLASVQRKCIGDGVNELVPTPSFGRC